jgi:hypothetical protein
VPRTEVGKARRLERWTEGDAVPERWQVLL